MGMHDDGQGVEIAGQHRKRTWASGTGIRSPEFNIKTLLSILRDCIDRISGIRCG